MVLISDLPSLEIPECTLANYVLQTIKKYGDTPALIDPDTDQVLTFREVGDLSLEYALKLRQLGLKRGEVVFLALPFQPYSVPIIFGIALNKAVIASSNFRYTVDEIACQASQVNAQMCVVDHRFAKQAMEGKLPETVKVLYLEDVQMVHVAASGNTLSAQIDDWFSSGDVDLKNDPFLFSFTSATTGLSKIALSANRDMLANAINASHEIERHSFKSCMTACEPFHKFPFCTTLMYLVRGIQHIMVPRLSPPQFLAYVSKYKVEMLFSAAQSALADIVREASLPSDNFPLKYIAMTGVKCPPDLLRSVREKFRITASAEWGMTEAGFITTGISPSTPVDSVGRLLPGNQLKVVDVITRKEIGANCSGELCVKAPNLMKEYYQRPDLTSEVMDADGWLKTGDLGRYDDDGYIYILDRIKDIIKTDGRLAIYPVELEAVLLSHPAVADVAVVRVTHPRYIEAPKAFVVRRPGCVVTAQELVEFFDARVATYKRLHGGVEFIDEIPKTGLGKPLKRLLGK